MTATNDVDTILSSQDLPVELWRLSSSLHPGDEPKVASMLSGMTALRHEDEVICPLMLRRNLVIPAWDDVVAQSVWHVK
ncbi:MAG: hypothetical protein ABW003_24540 [Microvirga sp.]